MIRSFATQGTGAIFDGRDTKEARRLPAPPGNRLEKLKGDRQGQHSIRINDRYRVCFRWSAEEPEDVEIVDYHR